MNTHTCRDLRCKRLKEEDGMAYCDQTGTKYGPKLTRQMYISDTACMAMRAADRRQKGGKE